MRRVRTRDFTVYHLTKFSDGQTPSVISHTTDHLLNKTNEFLVSRQFGRKIYPITLPVKISSHNFPLFFRMKIELSICVHSKVIQTTHQIHPDYGTQYAKEYSYLSYCH